MKSTWRRSHCWSGCSASSPRPEPPETVDSATRTFLVDLAVAFESEVWHHFDFEEKHLFEYLIAAGDTELARHLSDEHVQIKAVAERVIALARAGARLRFRHRPGASSGRCRSS